MEGKENRKSRFTSCLSYYDGKEVHQFMGVREGKLAKEPKGDTYRKWSDLWYIFIPDGFNKTLAEMTDEELDDKNRRQSSNAMDEFVKWYKSQNL